jgi:hypothetical protein
MASFAILGVSHQARCPLCNRLLLSSLLTNREAKLYIVSHYR